MDAIISFLEGIGSAITGFFAFVASLISDLVYLVSLTGKALAAIPSMVAWLPAPVLALLTTCITVAVLYKVLGRD